MANAQAAERTSDDTYTLFMGALDVVNEALEQNRDSKVFGFAIKTAEKNLSGQRLGVAIYADEPSSPFDYFTLRFTEGRFELYSRGKDEPDIAWKVSQDYLKDLVEHPQKYIDNPVKLDLDWLKDRAGL